MKHKLIDRDTVACVSDDSDTVRCAGDHGTPFTTAMPMTTEQLDEAESLYADNKFGQHPQEAARIAVAAREAAAVTSDSDLALVRRFTALATKLERIR